MSHPRKPELLRPVPASEFVGVDPKTLQDWRYRKIHLPFIKSGGLVYYRVDDLVAFLEKRTVSVAEVVA